MTAYFTKNDVISLSVKFVNEMSYNYVLESRCCKPEILQMPAEAAFISRNIFLKRLVSEQLSPKRLHPKEIFPETATLK